MSSEPDLLVGVWVVHAPHHQAQVNWPGLVADLKSHPGLVGLSWSKERRPVLPAPRKSVEVEALYRTDSIHTTTALRGLATRHGFVIVDVGVISGDHWQRPPVRCWTVDTTGVTRLSTPLAASRTQAVQAALDRTQHGTDLGPQERGR